MKAKRVRNVNFCGASSIPADVALHLLELRLGGKLVEAKAGVTIHGSGTNGGRVAGIADAIKSGDAKVEADSFLLGPDGRAPARMERDPMALHFDAELNAWTAGSPMCPSDIRAVRRSAALRGRDVAFQEYVAFQGRGAWRQALVTFALLAALGSAFR